MRRRLLERLVAYENMESGEQSSEQLSPHHLEELRSLGYID